MTTPHERALEAAWLVYCDSVDGDKDDLNAAIAAYLAARASDPEEPASLIDDDVIVDLKLTIENL